MSPYYILLIIAIYFLALYIISVYTSKNATNSTFFIGNRKSPWFLVAFGMIGASLSGVTFISVPGWVGSNQFSYLQMVLGYFAGYLVIGTVLMPIYYKMQLTSIYGYLDERFGKYSYKTGASFFLLSRTLGAALRLFLSASVMQVVLFNFLGVPFPVTVILVIFFIYLFTYKGGIRTVVYTDTIQTAFMLASLVGCVLIISSKLDMNFGTMVSTVYHSEFSKTFFFENWHDKRHFAKQFISGAFIAIAMTGLDQDLMQKNLSCKNLKDAQKNMFWFTITLLPVNLLFLSLGAMLYIFAAKTGFHLPAHSDELFPTIATQSFMPAIFSTIFILGLISSTYSSADSALTSLTTSVTIDIIGAHKKGEGFLTKTRKRIHILMAVVLVLLILAFKQLNNQSVISAVFTAAGYTYGPLLGIYAFGIFTKWTLHDKWVPVIAITSPLLCLLANYLLSWTLGFEILIINGVITFIGLWCIRRNKRIEVKW
jgi:SSS family solute:Na+ symporter